MIYSPKDLIRADYDRLLTILHVVFDLKHTVDPEPVSRSSLYPQQ